MLSKSQFIRGLQCHKSLWLYRHRPELRQQPSATQQAIFDSGTDVGLLAQQLFPGGVLVPFAGLSYEEQLDQTRKAIADGVETIYEATFVHDDIFVKVDILHKGVDGWELYEVKSSTGCKDVYLDDIAIQCRVVEGSGIPAARACLVHINNRYVRQGEIEVDRLFTCLDVTDEVRARQEGVSAEVNRQKTMLAGEAPGIDIGQQCEKPYPCDFRNHCWAHVPTPSVFELADIGKPDPYVLYQRGVVRLEDIPLQELGWRQQLQVLGTVHRQDHVEPAAVRKFLAGLWYPLCFLDFETTFLTPVPLFQGTRPYEQVPFQFSLHIQDEPGEEIRHIEFLANPGSDPQETFMAELFAALPESACILTYNQVFEIGRLKALAARLPLWQSAVAAILPNIRDLMAPFRAKAVYLWPMRGSYSIKQVLPAMVPDLSYADLAIGNGEEVSAAWLHLHRNPGVEEAAEIRQRLLDYCRLDTWGMVKIVHRLQEIAGSSKDRQDNVSPAQVG